MSDEWIGMTPRQRLINLFDAAIDCRVDVVIWQRDEPDAPDVLRAWAESRGVACEYRELQCDDTNPHGGCWSVQIGPHRSIDAWVLRATKARAA